MEKLTTNETLQLHAHIFPTLPIRMGGLASTQRITKGRHIGNDASEMALTYIIANATDMLEEMKQGSTNHAGQLGVTRDEAPGEITSRLLSIMPAHKMLDIDHNRVVR